MAISEYVSATGMIGSGEWSLSTNTSGPDVDTTDGVFQTFIDCANVTSDDEFKLTLYEKVRSGSTQRKAQCWYIAFSQSEPNFVTPPIVLMHGWDFTLMKSGGSGSSQRAFEWSIRQVS